MDRRKIDTLHLAHQTVDIAVEIIGLEHAGHDRCRARILRLQRFHQFQILRMEHPAHGRQRFGRGHPQAVDRLFLDARRGQLFVQLRTRTMDDDGRESDILQERERRRERAQIVAQHRATDLHQRETRRVQLREALEIL